MQQGQSGVSNIICRSIVAELANDLYGCMQLLWCHKEIDIAGEPSPGITVDGLAQ